MAKAVNQEHQHHGHRGNRLRMLEGLADNLTLILVAAFGVVMLVGLFITSGGPPGS